mgnify:CR=1 FL=1
MVLFVAPVPDGVNVLLASVVNAPVPEPTRIEPLLNDVVPVPPLGTVNALDNVNFDALKLLVI